MFIISLYYIKLIPLPHNLQNYLYGQNQINHINGFRTLILGGWLPQWFEPLLPDALPCRAAQIDWPIKQGYRFADGNVACVRQLLGKTFLGGRHQWPADPPRPGPQTYHGLYGRGSCPQSHRTGQAERPQSPGSLAESHGERSKRPDIQAFFISIGARYKRIRKRPRGVPSPQLYAYKSEKLQELEHLNRDGKIDLYYADESHVCTEGYVPYGWQFRDEDVYIPSQKAQRINIFGMIDRNNRYHGFTTTESIDADKVVEYLDAFSLSIKRDTFIVLDNASVHRNKKVRELRALWEKRRLFLFYLPPYSPHLNLAETLWRIMKTKWIRPQDYASSDNLFYTVNRALAAVGETLGIKLKHNAA